MKTVIVTLMHMIGSRLILLAGGSAGTKLTDIKSAFSADSAVSARERPNICLLPSAPSDNTNSNLNPQLASPNHRYLTVAKNVKNVFPVHLIFCL